MIMASNVSPSPSMNAAQLLGEHYWNEYDAAKRFASSNTTLAETNQYLIDQWNQYSRWNEGFTKGQIWSPLNLTSEEKEICDKVTAAFHPAAVAFANKDQAAWRTIYKIGLRLSDPNLEGKKASHIKKSRGALFKSFSALFQSTSAGVKVVLIFRRIHRSDYGEKKIYKALDMNSGEDIAVTMWSETPKGLRELLIPGKLETEKCPHLVPPYEAKGKIPKFKKMYGREVNKYVGIRPFYAKTYAELQPITSSQIQVILAVLKGVKYLHDKGHAHRDVKPQNIFDSPEGAKLGDYGLVCPLGDDNYSGTIDYASPETFRVHGGVTAKCAVWEIAVTGFEFLGYPVKDEKFIDLKIKNKLTDENVTETLNEWQRRRKINEAVTPLNPALFEIYRSCLRINPDDRPSIEELIEKFEKLAEPEAVQPSASKAAEV